MWDAVLESFIDTLYMLPFLFVLYILIELLEHKTRIGHPSTLLTGKVAPCIGASAGLIPMCGFSVMAAKLYERRYLTLGTLFAVFISTNDEAFLVLALSAMPIADKAISIALLCAVKLVTGLAIGYLIDFIFRKKNKFPEPLPSVERSHEHEHEHDHEHEDEPHACEHKHKGNVQVYLVSPLLHALKIAAVIFVINLVFELAFYFIGEDVVIGFLQGAGLWYQPLVCCLVGLIPNCASSVAIAEAYAVGSIAFGSCLGGLITNAGLGVLVLFKNAKAVKRNLAILAAMFLIGLVSAYVVNAISLAL